VIKLEGKRTYPHQPKMSVRSQTASHRVQEWVQNGSKGRLNLHGCCSVEILASLPPGVTELDCSSSELTSLPPLPDGLVMLWCDFNNLYELGTLPTSLRRLSCQGNCFVSIDGLPASLRFLDISVNHHLTSFSVPENGLLELNCYNCRLGSLPRLPDSLVRLDCHNNWIRNFHDDRIPPLLTSLDITSNEFVMLPALPSELQTLYCCTNPLRVLPDLSTTLRILAIGHTNIMWLPPFVDGGDHPYVFMARFSKPWTSLSAAWLRGLSRLDVSLHIETGKGSRIEPPNVGEPYSAYIKRTHPFYRRAPAIRAWAARRRR